MERRELICIGCPMGCPLSVETEEGKEVLIPAIHECVLDIDVEENRMEIHLMDGLLD